MDMIWKVAVSIGAILLLMYWVAAFMWYVQ